MSTKKHAMQIILSPTEPTIVMSRLLDAPREKVWEAFTKAEHVARWYGGHGFSSPVCEIDARVGGHWHHVMRTPDGSEFPLDFVYTEVVKPSRLAWQHVDFGKDTQGPPRSHITAVLEDRGAQTKWTMTARFRTMAERDHTAESGFTNVVTQGTEKLDAIAQAIL